jgi:ion channel
MPSSVVAAAVAAALLFVAVLVDAFETILLPRRVIGRWRISRLVVRSLWAVWGAIAAAIPKRSTRESWLSGYALIALLVLFAVWAGGLVLAFGLGHWAAGSQVATAHGRVGFGTLLYMSGTTFFTLGLGDVNPTSTAARALTVVEAGMGFGFLALVIAYLPVLYQLFSKREARITLLDAWAGSPPCAAVLLRRCFEAEDPAVITQLLEQWELAAAEILESHLSYPVLAFFRSQHDNQSWLASLTAVLDACALVLVGIDRLPTFQARLTFAIGRHTLVDLAQAFGLRPGVGADRRLTPTAFAELRSWLVAAAVPLRDDSEAEMRLRELHSMYAPYVEALSVMLRMPPPSWLPPAKARYNWETTAWARTVPDDAH